MKKPIIEPLVISNACYKDETVFEVIESQISFISDAPGNKFFNFPGAKLLNNDPHCDALLISKESAQPWSNFFIDTGNGNITSLNRFLSEFQMQYDVIQIFGGIDLTKLKFALPMGAKLHINSARRNVNAERYVPIDFGKQAYFEIHNTGTSSVNRNLFRDNSQDDSVLVNLSVKALSEIAWDKITHLQTQTISGAKESYLGNINLIVEFGADKKTSTQTLFLQNHRSPYTFQPIRLIELPSAIKEGRLTEINFLVQPMSKVLFHFYENLQ